MTVRLQHCQVILLGSLGLYLCNMSAFWSLSSKEAMPVVPVNTACHLWLIQSSQVT